MRSLLAVPPRLAEGAASSTIIYSVARPGDGGENPVGCQCRPKTPVAPASCCSPPTSHVQWSRTFEDGRSSKRGGRGRGQRDPACLSTSCSSTRSPLDAKDCGPTVIPSIRTAVKWVYQALHEAARHEGSTNAWTCAGAVLKRGGRHSYRGGPRPRNARHDAGAAALRAPCHIMVWLFCMIFASLRFDDAKHVKPLEMEMRSE